MPIKKTKPTIKVKHVLLDKFIINKEDEKALDRTLAILNECCGLAQNMDIYNQLLQARIDLRNIMVTLCEWEENEEEEEE